MFRSHLSMTLHMVDLARIKWCEPNCCRINESSAIDMHGHWQGARWQSGLSRFQINGGRIFQDFYCIKLGPAHPFTIPHTHKTQLEPVGQPAAGAEERAHKRPAGNSLFCTSAYPPDQGGTSLGNKKCLHPVPPFTLFFGISLV